MSDNPIIVFIHGFCESSKIWQFQESEFNTDYNVLSVNLPGFGGQELTNASSLSDIAQDVLNSLPLRAPLFLIGHSLGGYVAAEIYLLAKKRIKGICLFHSTLIPDSLDKKENRTKTINFLSKHGKDLFLKQFVPSLFSAGNLSLQSDNYLKMEQIAFQTPLETIICYTKWMRDRDNYLELLKDVGLPILYIAGSDDQFIPLEQTKGEILSIPTSSLAILDNTGHLGMIESPVHSSEIIKVFLKSLLS